jgi:hypothetical protein
VAHLPTCVIGLVLAAAVLLRHVNTTTVALVLVLAVVCIALKWGWLERAAARRLCRNCARSCQM